MLKKIYITAIGLCYLPNFAFAMRANDMGDLFENSAKNVSEGLTLLETVSYISGITFGLLGILKLKAYMEKPTGQITFKDALTRLLAAGFFLALPTFISIILETTIGGGTGEFNIVDMNI